MKKKLLPIVFLFAILAMNAQITFQKTYGGPNDDKGYYAQQTSDGGYVLAGYASDFISGSGRDAYLVKTDANGNLQWSQTYGSTNDEVAWCAEQTTDNGYIVSGTTNSGNNNTRGFLIKTNPAGDTSWAKTYGNVATGFSSVRQTNDGGYIAAGAHYDVSAVDIAYGHL